MNAQYEQTEDGSRVGVDLSRGLHDDLHGPGSPCKDSVSALPIFDHHPPPLAVYFGFFFPFDRNQVGKTPPTSS